MPRTRFDRLAGDALIDPRCRVHRRSRCPLPAAPIDGLRCVELTPLEEPLLQRFFEDNPAYFVAVYGEPAGADEAHEEIHGLPPAEMPFSDKCVVGYLDASGGLAAMVNVITDLMAPGVWHIGTFIVATARHGNGDAAALHRSIEDWARANGAAWLRLGVVAGNARAESFWRRSGYLDTRSREGIVMGRRTNTIRLMMKPLAGGTLADYLARVPRDRLDT